MQITTIRMFEPTPPGNLLHDAAQAYMRAVGAWEGCDWKTSFGPQLLDLNSLTARQARLLADATSGEESVCWEEASLWLEGIERDAKAARNYAAAATGLLPSNVLAALDRIESAFKLEAKYREPTVWKLLRDVIHSIAASKISQSEQEVAVSEHEAQGVLLLQPRNDTMPWKELAK